MTPQRRSTVIERNIADATGMVTFFAAVFCAIFGY